MSIISAAMQVQQVKKTNKFDCRMCQAKQAVAKVYAISGSAKDIRAVVMEVNAKRALTEDSLDEDSVTQPSYTAAGPASEARHGQWEEFVSEEELAATDPDADNMTDKNAATYVTSIPEQQRQKRKGEATRHAAVSDHQPMLGRQPHKLARTQGQFCSSSTKYSPRADHQQSDVLRENRMFILNSVATTQHHAVVGVAAKALHPTVLPQKVATSSLQKPPLGSIQKPSFGSMQKPLLDKPVTTLKQSNTAAPTVGRWSDFIATNANELAGHTWHSVPGGIDDSNEDACLVTSLD